MRSLDYTTVVALGAIGFLAISLALVFAARASSRQKGLSYLLIGGALLMLSSFSGFVRWPSLALEVEWAYHSASLSILGFSLAMAGVKRQLGYGLSVRWYIGVGLCCAGGLELARALIPGYSSLRTMAFSLAHLLIIVPLIAKEYRRSVSVLRLFLLLLGALAAVSGLRLVFAFLDLKGDNFLPTRHDSWLYLAIIVFGLSAFSIIVSLIARARPEIKKRPIQRERSSIALSSYGLTAAESRYLLDALAGMSSKEIAARYGIADSTVRNTLSRSYRKCGVSDLRALSALAGGRVILP